MRLFVAIYPPIDALDDLANRVDRLRVGRAAAAGVNTRVTARETYHVTLAFLGEVDDARLPEVEAALERAVAAWRPSHSAASPLLWLAGGGRFGRGRFTLLWAGLRGDVLALGALGVAVRQELKGAGLPYDARPLRPHVTLARPGDRLDREAVDADRAALNDYAGPPWPLAEMVLMRSHLGPRPQYDRLAAWPLQ